jgi:hypothetical protein
MKSVTLFTTRPVTRVHARHYGGTPPSLPECAPATIVTGTPLHSVSSHNRAGALSHPPAHIVTRYVTYYLRDTLLLCLIVLALGANSVTVRTRDARLTALVSPIKLGCRAVLVLSRAEQVLLRSSDAELCSCYLMPSKCCSGHRMPSNAQDSVASVRHLLLTIPPFNAKIKQVPVERIVNESLPCSPGETDGTPENRRCLSRRQEDLCRRLLASDPLMAQRAPRRVGKVCALAQDMVVP